MFQISTIRLFLFAISIAVAATKLSGVKLIDNGYSGVLVAIDRDVPEDVAIIDGIKKILTNGSKQLYSSTELRAYFKVVTILIPPTWTHKKEYLPKMKETYSNADFVVAPENKKYGDTPYVKSFGGCGDPGEYVHFTPAFVTDDNVRKNFGDMGKVVVHEWGHYRWGLQEEYPAAFGEAKWYFSTVSKQFEAVRCSLSTKGRILQVTGTNKYRICKLSNGLPDSQKCHFYPGFKIDNPSKVSIMDRQGTKGVDQFCKHGADENHQHNAEAPSRMNRLCGGKSAWDVMLAHEDFRNSSNLPSDLGQKDLDPDFRLVQANKNLTQCRISLVLDISGSMNSDHKMEKMNKGLQKLVRFTLNEGTEIGLSTFSYNGIIRCPMRKITDEQSRLNFLNSCLVKRGNGGTSIGSGLLKGVENLGTARGGDRILLLTDGEQNQSPGPKDPRVMQALENSKAFVDAVSFTAAADKSMVEIAQKFGGNYFYDSNNVNSNSLNDAFAKNPCDDSDEEADDKDIALASAAGAIFADDVVGFVGIDASVGLNTTFLFDYGLAGKGTQGAGIIVVLMSPSKVTYNESSVEYEVDPDFKTIVISIPGEAEVGRWDYVVKKATNQIQTYKINVFTKARDVGGTEKATPLTIHASVKSTDVDYPSPMIIYGEVRKGGNPVLGLRVVASVDRPGQNNPYELELRDNGRGADAVADDGVYARYFTAFTEIGRYSFGIQASDLNGTGVVRAFKNAGGWGGGSLAFDENNLRPESAPTFEDEKIEGEVTRSTTAGASELQPGSSNKDDVNSKLKNGVDEIPPDKIADLRVTGTSKAAGNVTLTFTAPGDNYDEGRVNKYSVRVESNDSTAFFGMPTDIEVEPTVDAGEMETMTLNVQPEGAGSASFTVVVTGFDEDGNQGGDSNSVTFGLGYVPDIVDGQLPFGDGGSSSPTVIIVVVVVVVIVLVAVVLGIVLRHKKRHNKRCKTTGRDNPNFVKSQVESIDAEQQFKYKSGGEEVRQVTVVTTTTTKTRGGYASSEPRYVNVRNH